MPTEKPRIAGELRLRVTSSDDAESFESGSDLLLPDGQLWSRSLYFLPKYYFPLYEKLREDRLIPDDLDTALMALPSKRPHHRTSHILYTLNDTFIVDFSISQKSFFVITEQGAEMQQIIKIFVPRDLKLPYTGAYTDHHLSTLLY